VIGSLLQGGDGRRCPASMPPRAARAKGGEHFGPDQLGEMRGWRGAAVHKGPERRSRRQLWESSEALTGCWLSKGENMPRDHLAEAAG